MTFRKPQSKYRKQRIAQQNIAKIFSRSRPSRTQIDEVVVRVADSDDAKPSPLQFRDFGACGIADLVRDRGDPEKLKIFLWNEGIGSVHDTLTLEGCTFTPIELDPSVIRFLSLPSNASTPEDPECLISDITKCLGRYLDIEQRGVTLAAHFVLASWVTDLLPVAPYLSVTGPFGSGKTTLASLLQSLCRRGICIVDPTASTLYRLGHDLVPTLVIDEFSAGRSASTGADVARLLRTGNSRKGGVLRGNKFYQAFCPKVLISRQGYQDAALASRTVTIALRPTRKQLPVLDDARLERIAAEFQPRLLGFRLQNCRNVAKYFHADVPNFVPRMKDLARALGAPLLGNQKIIDALFEALATQDREASLNRHAEPEWAVALALYKESHKAAKHLTMGELAETVAEVLASNGESYRLSARAVGAHVGALGLSTQKLGNEGRGLLLTQELQKQLHQLAIDMGIIRCDLLPWWSVESGFGGYVCYLCDSMGLMQTEGGVKLRTILPDTRRRRTSVFDRKSTT